MRNTPLTTILQHAEQQTLPEASEAAASHAEEAFVAFDSNVWHRMEDLAIPISEVLFAAHLRVMDYEIDHAPTDEMRRYWNNRKARRVNCEGKLILPIGDALEAHSELAEECENPDGSNHERHAAFRDIMTHMISDGWHGQDIDGYHEALCKLLHNPAQQSNLTPGYRSAGAIADEIIDHVYEARANFKGRSFD